MEDNLLASGKDRERLDRIIRRVEFLEDRIKNNRNNKNLHHDNAEHSALCWAVKIIIERFPELALEKNLDEVNLRTGGVLKKADILNP